MKVCTYFIHALSPLHAGIGSGVGPVDLPIAREVVTRLPVYYGSGIKGVLRAKHSSPTDDFVAVFGPDTDKSDEHAGAITFSDARLLCLPVRSICGTFAWTTSPIVLHRLARDMELPNWKPIELNGFQAHVVDSESLLLPENGQKILLEDLDLERRPDEQGVAKEWAERIGKLVFPDDEPWQAEFRRRFAILGDDVFSFLYENALEVRARIRLEENLKVVKEGALWYEEALPAESILWGIALAEQSYKEGINLGPNEIINFAFTGDKSNDNCKECILQLGGKATVGYGRARLVKS
ncbi:MAG: type III-B CRISPR module RAMP protein Cmr4 [Candidatus Eisenbacteria bacterium]